MSCDIDCPRQTRDKIKCKKLARRTVKLKRKKEDDFRRKATKKTCEPLVKQRLSLTRLKQKKPKSILVNSKPLRPEEEKLKLTTTKSKKRPCRPGKVTRNPFFNFLRFFRCKHCNWNAVKVAVEGAKVWRTLSDKEKDKYRMLAPEDRKRKIKSRRRRRRAVFLSQPPPRRPTQDTTHKKMCEELRSRYRRLRRNIISAYKTRGVPHRRGGKKVESCESVLRQHERQKGEEGKKGKRGGDGCETLLQNFSGGFLYKFCRFCENLLSF